MCKKGLLTIALISAFGVGLSHAQADSLHPALLNPSGLSTASNYWTIEGIYVIAFFQGCNKETKNLAFAALDTPLAVGDCPGVVVGTGIMPVTTATTFPVAIKTTGEPEHPLLTPIPKITSSSVNWGGIGVVSSPATRPQEVVKKE